MNVTPCRLTPCWLVLMLNSRETTKKTRCLMIWTGGALNYANTFESAISHFTPERCVVGQSIRLVATCLVHNKYNNDLSVAIVYRYYSGRTYASVADVFCCKEILSQKRDVYLRHRHNIKMISSFGLYLVVVDLSVVVVLSVFGQFDPAAKVTQSCNSIHHLSIHFYIYIIMIIINEKYKHLI